MRTVDSHLLDGKIEETVTHYITSHQSGEAVHVDTNGLTLNVQEDVGGRVVTVMHPHNFTPNMCRQVTVGEQVGDGPWNEELLDTDGRIAAIVAHLSQHSRSSQHQHHMKVTSIRGDVDASVILDAPLRLFNGQIMEQPVESSLVEAAGQLPPLPPLQGLKRCPPTDWFNNNTKTILKDDTQMLTDSDGPVLELGSGASPGQNKQSKKSLPHKKRISKKLKRNTGNSTPQEQGIVIINCAEGVQQEEILPDNFVASVQHEQHLPEENQHITHEVRPIFICQLCGEFYGDEQLKFYHHLKQHYEPHSTIIIENPVSDLNIDKMATTCIVDNVATLPDSIVELSLENTVPKTMYQPIDKHVLYTSSEKTLNYTNNKLQYSMASMDKEQPVPTVEAEKTDLYETLEKLELYSCMKCNKSFRKQKQCEAHIMEVHSNTKLEDINEFSEPEDLMEGIHVAVDETQEHYQPLLPHLTVDSGHVHQEHVRHWYIRNGNVCGENEASPGADTGPSPGASPSAGTCGTDGAYCPVCPAPRPASPHLKEEVLQRIFETEVSNGETNFSENIIPDNVEAQEPTSPSEHKPVIDKKVKKFECQQCSRVFHHRNSLMYHVLSHSDKQQMCRECGKSFYTAAALKVHKRVHNGDRPCKCDECGRRFRQWSDLKYHKSSIHSNQKHFRCEFCSKQFARKYSLNLHRKIHTGERDYKCEYCDKSFRASSYRLSHMRTHTGDRPYKCNECEKCFRVAGDLRRHSRIHEKLRHRIGESKTRVQRRNLPQATNNPPTEPLESTSSRRSSSKSTSTPKKPHKPKKNVLKKGAPPNVTVSRSEFKISDYENSEAFDTRQQIDYKFKDVYSHSEYPKDTFKVKEYNEQMYKENERLNDVSMIKGQICETDKPFARGNTDGKMHIFTHIEKSKEYNGPIVASAVSLGDIRHLEREVRDVRSDGIHGENIENGFLERLTALYNIPA